MNDRRDRFQYPLIISVAVVLLILAVAFFWWTAHLKRPVSMESVPLAIVAPADLHGRLVEVPVNLTASEAAKTDNSADTPDEKPKPPVAGRFTEAAVAAIRECLPGASQPDSMLQLHRAITKTTPMQDNVTVDSELIEFQNKLGEKRKLYIEYGDARKPSLANARYKLYKEDAEGYPILIEADEQYETEQYDRDSALQANVLATQWQGRVHLDDSREMELLVQNRQIKRLYADLGGRSLGCDQRQGETGIGCRCLR